MVGFETPAKRRKIFPAKDAKDANLETFDFDFELDFEFLVFE
jgi:hypothetical protein